MGHWGKAARPLAGSIIGYGLPDIASYHAVAMSHIRSVIARHSKPLRSVCLISTCVIRWSILPHAEVCNNYSYNQHRNLRASRRVIAVSALSQVAGGAVLGKSRIRTQLEA